MDKRLTVPKWVLINRPKVPQMPQNFWSNLSAKAQKFEIFERKISLWVSVVRALDTCNAIKVSIFTTIPVFLVMISPNFDSKPATFHRIWRKKLTEMSKMGFIRDNRVVSLRLQVVLQMRQHLSRL